MLGHSSSIDQKMGDPNKLRSPVILPGSLTRSSEERGQAAEEPFWTLPPAKQHRTRHTRAYCTVHGLVACRS
jgi:hypothetical protein